MLSELNNKKIHVGSPFYHMDKTEMVEWYIKKGFSTARLRATVGCYTSDEGHCGNCPACFRRFVAFMNNGVEPGYVLSPEVKDYYRSNAEKYSTDRQERMLQWV